MTIRILITACLVAGMLLQFGCSTGNRRSVAQVTPGQYLVKRGDTLSSIAWRFQLDYQTLARWNKISSPYTIHPGQRLYLSPPGGQRTPPRVAEGQRHESGPVARPSEPAGPVPRSYPYRPDTPPPVQKSIPIQWQWPTGGRIVRHFSPPGSSGLDIQGELGQSVLAAADGTVVYSGAGLKGYGELIIIKHSEAFLSAYAHNRLRFVKEGDKVKRSEKIAELGENDSKNAILHFEIRKNGKPVDPSRFLPKISR